MKQVTLYPLADTLQNYLFASTAASSTLTGFFTDANGAQCSNLFTQAITSTPIGFATIGGGSIPANAVGFVGTLTVAALYVARSPGYTPGSGYPQAATSNYITFGYVEGANPATHY